ncbi:hypothetical protein EMPS_08793 [Entomortierella parvispora]|uniref:RRM domain-containing protein n=1 Tax=Entomortierella parvispora TaxID=205924 RepID=A0A9P3LZM7_9FUNG|nr:hypothetical protein EMPS_08793 [Entomortierella parvispora]
MRRDNSNGTSIHVSGFKDSTRPSDLAVLFEPYGRIADVYIPKNYYTGVSRGFAYIQYENDEDARRVMEGGDQFSLDGRRLTLEYAQGRRKSPNQMRHGERRGGDRGRGRSRSRSRSRDRRYRRSPRRYSRSRSPSRDRRDRRDRRRDSRSPVRRRSRSPTPSRSRSPYRRESSRRSPSPRERGYRSPSPRRGSYRSPSPKRGSYRSPSPRRQTFSPRGYSPRQPAINQEQGEYPPAEVEGYTPPRHISPASFNNDGY